MKKGEFSKKEKFGWANIFIRDILITFVILGLHYMTNFRSNTLFFITGMLVVWVTWQFTDFIQFIKEKKGL